MIRLLADENVDYDLVRGALRRRPEFHFIRVQSVGLTQTVDPDILAWAAVERRVIVTHDVNTMPGFARQRMSRGEPMAGLFIVHQEGVPELTLAASCGNMVPTR